MENDYTNKNLLIIGWDEDYNDFFHTEEYCHLYFSNNLVIDEIIVNKQIQVILFYINEEEAKFIKFISCTTKKYPNIPIIIIHPEKLDDNYQQFLYLNGVFDIIKLDILNQELLTAKINWAIKVNNIYTREDNADKSHQLLHANKLVTLGRIASYVAHDFNNQLMTIIGFSNLAQEEICGNKKLCAVQEYLTTIHEAAKKSAYLVRELLSFSRRPKVQFNYIFLHEITNKTAHLLINVIGKKYKFNVLSSDNSMIYADTNQIEQLIYNLVINASDAMPEGGMISLSVKKINISKHSCNSNIKKGEYVLLSVEDKGVGIDEDQKKRIFEPYYTTKDSGRGTGLGLSTVVGIVKNHKGYITVSSSINMGTTFDIYFPLAKILKEDKCTQYY